MAGRSPSTARTRPSAATIGMALIPEDRKTEGLMLPMSVRDNLSFAALGRFSTLGVVDGAAEAEAVARMMRMLAIRSDGTDLPAGSLSGGNQQKLVIAKWLMMAPRIILLNDPTRGIDVGTKQEIYALLRQLADAGAAILFYSTDYDELIGCCDRVLVIYDGRGQARAGRRRDHRAGADQQRSQHRRRRARRGERGPAMSGDWPYRLREHRGTLLAFAGLRGHVRDLRQQPSSRPQRQRRHDRGQQGRAAGDRRHGADASWCSPPASTSRSAWCSCSPTAWPRRSSSARPARRRSACSRSSASAACAARSTA